MVRALIKAALRPLKSRKTSSTVRGLYGAPTTSMVVVKLKKQWKIRE